MQLSMHLRGAGERACVCCCCVLAVGRRDDQWIISPERRVLPSGCNKVGVGSTGAFVFPVSCRVWRQASRGVMPGACPQKLRSGKGAGGEESCKNGSTSRERGRRRATRWCAQYVGYSTRGLVFEKPLAWPLQSEVQRSAAAAAAEVVLCCRCRATERELKHGESHDPPSARKEAGAGTMSTSERSLGEHSEKKRRTQVQSKERIILGQQS